MIDLKLGKPDPYDAVLADLRQKRDELDAAIRTLETLRDGRLGITPASVPAPRAQESLSENPEGMFAGMSIVDATKKLLKMRKRPLANAEILREIQVGGVVLTGADPLNVVGSVLTRRFNTVGDVVRINRGTWGLREWYPGRNFKSAVATKLVASDSNPAPGEPHAVYELQVNDLSGSGASLQDDDL